MKLSIGRVTVHGQGLDARRLADRLERELAAELARLLAGPPAPDPRRGPDRGPDRGPVARVATVIADRLRAELARREVRR